MRDPLKDPKRYVTRYEGIFIAPGRSHDGAAARGFSKKKDAVVHAAKLQLEGTECRVNTVTYWRSAGLKQVHPS